MLTIVLTHCKHRHSGRIQLCLKVMVFASPVSKILVDGLEVFI